MAKYRKIDPQIWNDEKFRALPDDGKLAFLMILTHPNMTMLGAMRHSVEGLAAELGWSTERLRKGLAEPFAKGMLRVDRAACFLWAPKFLKYNPPDNPNVVKSWTAALSQIPECRLKYLMVKEVKGFVEGLPEPFGEALPKPFGNGMPIQEQEQEQDKKNPPVSPPKKPAAKPWPRISGMTIETIYNAYPRQVGKRRALTAIENAVSRIAVRAHPPDDPAAWLLDRVRAYAKSPAGQQGTFTPHPATWLNGGHYDDDAKEWTCDDQGKSRADAARSGQPSVGPEAHQRGARAASERRGEYPEPDRALPTL